MVLQGSILVPILFYIFVYDIPIRDALLALLTDNTAILTQHHDLIKRIKEYKGYRYTKNWNFLVQNFTDGPVFTSNG